MALKDFEEFVKALTRPIIAVMVVFGLIFFIVEGVEYPETFYHSLVIGTLAWFGIERTLFHRAERKDKNA